MHQRAFCYAIVLSSYDQLNNDLYGMSLLTTLPSFKQKVNNNTCIINTFNAATSDDGLYLQ